MKKKMKESGKFIVRGRDKIKKWKRVTNLQ